MKALVTGSAGFIGYFLANTLAEQRDNEIVCVDNFLRGADDDAYRSLVSLPNVTAFTLDLNDPFQVRQLPDDVDTIFHLAALNGTQNFYERPFEVLKCCTLPTINLLEKYGPLGRLQRWVYAGSSEAYADTVSSFDWPVPTDESVPLTIRNVFNPRWSYGASKLHGEVATIAGCNRFSIPFTIIRYHNAYGPRMGDKHVIPDFLTRASQGVYTLYGWEETRSFIYIGDAVRATIELANAHAAANEIVNVGSPREIRILELAEMLLRICKIDAKVVCQPAPEGSVKRRVPDIAKLVRLTAFRERWTLEGGLELAAHYYINRRDRAVATGGQQQLRSV